jgi:tetratricopeptide (TPR) repeat protein
LKAAQKLFSKLTEEKTIALDYEYYGKILVLNGKDSLGVDMLRKAYELDNSRCDLLNEIWKSYDKMQKNAEAAATLQEKIQHCKGATVADYFNMGRSWFFAGEFQKADSAMAKVTELSPKYASGYLWRAKANYQMDTTNALGLAKPHYEKYIEVALADTSSNAAAKYKTALIQAYHYLADYYFFKAKNNEKAKENLRKILALDPSDKNAADALRGIELQEKQEKEKKEKGSGK